MSLVITNLQGEIQDRLEEAQYLREALNRTRESLECEQRLHSAAKTRKVKNVYKQKSCLTAKMYNKSE